VSRAAAQHIACGLAVALCCAPAFAAEKIAALYPEGPLWSGGDLFFAEMTANRVSRWDGTRSTPFWNGENECGPTAITGLGEVGFVVACHRTGEIMLLDTGGKELARTGIAMDGAKLRDPNDINADGLGGAFFSDPGRFSPGAPAEGIVYHLDPMGRVHAVANQLKYPNGVAYDAATNTLYVSEHLRQRVLALRLNDNMVANGISVFLTRDDLFGGEEPDSNLSGPDGLRFDSDGALYVALYGEGRVLVVRPDGTRGSIAVPMKFTTSMALSDDRVAVTGVHDNMKYPHEGTVYVLPKADALR
jgi:sugar lactone lactonase YvrE